MLGRVGSRASHPCDFVRSDNGAGVLRWVSHDEDICPFCQPRESMHDDIGSSLTSVRAVSTFARSCSVRVGEVEINFDCSSSFHFEDEGTGSFVSTATVCDHACSDAGFEHSHGEAIHAGGPTHLPKATDWARFQSCEFNFGGALDDQPLWIRRAAAKLHRTSHVRLALCTPWLPPLLVDLRALDLHESSLAALSLCFATGAPIVEISIAVDGTGSSHDTCVPAWSFNAVALCVDGSTFFLGVAGGRVQIDSRALRFRRRLSGDQQHRRAFCNHLGAVVGASAAPVSNHISYV